MGLAAFNRLRRMKAEELEKEANSSKEEKEAKMKAEELDLANMSVEELKAYAEEVGIDLGKSTSHEGILKKITDALEEKEKSE